MEDAPEREVIASITPDVMKCVNRVLLFERLDDLLCPKDDSKPGESCRHDFRLSESLLRASGFVESSDMSEILNVLKSLGACCDCEVLYNVAESSRLKARYWQNRAKHTCRQTSRPV